MGDVVYFPRKNALAAPLSGLEQALLEFHEAVAELQRACQAHDDARQVYGTADEDQDDGA
jgi:hypothetical protein